MPVQKSRSRGSLLVDWSTAASLLASAVMFVPGLRTFICESQRAAVVNSLQVELRRAMRAANDMGKPVSICATPVNGTGCADDRNWSFGWTAFVDEDGDGHMAAHEPRLWKTQNSHPNIAVTAASPAFSFWPYYRHDGLHQSTVGRITVTDRTGFGGERTIDVGYGGFAQLLPQSQPAAAKAPARRSGLAVIACAMLVLAYLAWRLRRAARPTRHVAWTVVRTAPKAAATRSAPAPVAAPAAMPASCRDVVAALLASLRQEPARQDLRRTLLEIHFATRQADAFVSLAREYFERGLGANDPFWPAVGAMGMRLAPDQAIFRAVAAC